MEVLQVLGSLAGRGTIRSRPQRRRHLKSGMAMATPGGAAVTATIRREEEQEGQGRAPHSDGSLYLFARMLRSTQSPRCLLGRRISGSVT